MVICTCVMSGHVSSFHLWTVMSSWHVTTRPLGLAENVSVMDARVRGVGVRGVRESVSVRGA